MSVTAIFVILEGSPGKQGNTAHPGTTYPLGTEYPVIRGNKPLLAGRLLILLK